MCGKNRQYEISVIVASYNPVWEKMKKTLMSILLQKHINFEIIIVDDGSKDDLFNEIRQLFYKYDFNCYRLSPSIKNEGTVKNLYRGIQLAVGDYIKTISPGDCLYNEYTLANWYSFVKRNKFSVSFGDYICYNEHDCQCNIVVKKHSPYNAATFSKFTERNKMIYLVLHDYAIGSTFLSERRLTKKYFSIIENKIKYAEDCIFKLMIFQNIPLQYYSDIVIWYEVGTGISTSGSQFWQSAIEKDNFVCDNIMQQLNKNSMDQFATKYFKLVNCDKKGIKRKIYALILFPSLFIEVLYRKFFKKYTTKRADKRFYHKFSK
jgi:glycosyltransferase involved in cell wall biosynthesis